MLLKPQRPEHQRSEPPREDVLDRERSASAERAESDQWSDEDLVVIGRRRSAVVGRCYRRFGEPLAGHRSGATLIARLKVARSVYVVRSQKNTSGRNNSARCSETWVPVNISWA